MVSVSKNFEMIYREHYRQIHLFLYRLSGSAEAADEMTAQTFSLAYKQLYTYDKSYSVYAWLCSVATKVFFRYLRTEKKSNLMFDFYVIDLASSITEEPGRRLLKEVGMGKLRKAVRNLPPKYTYVLIMKIYAELSYEELALKLEMSTATVKTIFHRAKEQIMEELFDEKL